MSAGDKKSLRPDTNSKDDILQEGNTGNAGRVEDARTPAIIHTLPLQLCWKQDLMVFEEASPSNPVEENVYEFNKDELAYRNIATLPGSLGEAIEELKKSKLMETALGSHTYQVYIHSKMAEWDEPEYR